MKMALAKVVTAVKEDTMKLRRYTRGVLAWLAAVGMQMTAAGPDAMAEWTARRWVIGFFVAALAGTVGLINLGDKNEPT